MTLEEAVERVLQGATYLPCTECEGACFSGPIQRLEDYGGIHGRIFIRAACTTCEGHGSLLDPVYAFACGMSGALLPERPFSQGYSLSEIIRRQPQWELEWEEDQRILELLDEVSRES